jgi:cytoskeletal protein CcmA (bactofilin family)
MDTIVGKDTEIKGTVIASSGLRIDGKMEGEIHNKGDVVVGKGARVRASIKARHLTLAGDVEGNIDLSGKLEIESTGRLKGDIKVAALIIADGGFFDGSSKMAKELEDASHAVARGHKD